MKSIACWCNLSLPYNLTVCIYLVITRNVYKIMFKFFQSALFSFCVVFWISRI
ncbi:hypothetical protein C0J52_00870 [Blattella germanica]|nr:hypothetical protein C0J52_00870 [Blattella germanica]